MTPSEERELFARLGGHVFEKWLADEMADCVKYLTQSTDQIAIYRAQGKALFIEHVQKLVAASKK